MAPATEQHTARIEVHGTVQGVGFRPFVYRLATALGVRGDVSNVGGHVVIHAQSRKNTVQDFLRHLAEHAPPHARIERIVVTEPTGPVGVSTGFTVTRSTSESGQHAPRELPPDLATCPACVRELFDPEDRRYRYPFLNCTACGPRATIVEDLPYDRERTVMRRFPLCPECRAEYLDPANRRFHAEPIACPVCGPRLSWHARGSPHATAVAEDALRQAVLTIADGGVVAVKGIGGYQLICDATVEDAVRRVRVGKHRPSKPLAVMVNDLGAARSLSDVDDVGDAAERLLTSAAGPIVLLGRTDAGVLAPGVAPEVAELGLFLPYSPLHHLLLAELDRPLVVTSGNRAGEPIIIDDATALRVLGPLTDGLLAHDRPIRSRYDDSVLRVVAGRSTTIRRARGYAPAPLPLPHAAPLPVLAVGAQLKHTTTLAVGGHAVIGPHTGDLSDHDTLTAFEDTIGQLCRWADVEPALYAYDLHPGYLSSQYAMRFPERARMAVQHHHAHVAATAAEHGVDEPFLGLAYDGLGMGEDGTFWGGELLLADYQGFSRLGRIALAPLPGGASAIRRPARTALGYLFGAETLGAGGGIDTALAGPLLERMPAHEVAVIRRMVKVGLNCPRASSVGRLFDAAAAFLGLCDDASYEGEAAVLLEAAARPHHGLAALPWRLAERDGLTVFDTAPTLRALLTSAQDSPVGPVAARFHRAVAEATLAMVERAARSTGVRTVCLGGGVFQNRLMVTDLLAGLADLGMTTHIGQEVPMNDGGISYGQAVIAAARLAG
ncbi:carbamoyltransferase HypF [Allokutzneria oryzae]|uniref:Carbamoyltransferase n=1 Tax=Allokutzneria oryzae TaxID=1378989 RepID=A0ABV5ZWX2_9PSEU